MPTARRRKRTCGRNWHTRAASSTRSRPGEDPCPADTIVEHRQRGTPQVGGEWYFYTRREGMQNQPVLYVRKD